MNFLQTFLLFIARLCLASIFIWAAISKFMFFDHTVQYMTAKGFTAVPVFLVGAAAVEFFAGISLIIGYKARLGAALLLIYLIPTTILFHDFWNVTGEEQSLQLIMFLKNLSIFGGLLYVVCHGAGRFACDHLHRHSTYPSTQQPYTRVPEQKP